MSTCEQAEERREMNCTATMRWQVGASVGRLSRGKFRAFFGFGDTSCLTKSQGHNNLGLQLPGLVDSGTWESFNHGVLSKLLISSSLAIIFKRTAFQTTPETQLSLRYYKHCAFRLDKRYITSNASMSGAQVHHTPCPSCGQI